MNMANPRGSHPLFLLLLLGACEQPATAMGPRPVLSAQSSTARHAAAALPVHAPDARVWSRRRWARWVEELSEPDGSFLSDNYVSNETSFLQPSKALARTAAGGVYIGVGPEQNFSYLALSRPRLAILVDLRRDNLLLHLLYKACFEQAQNRRQFLELLLARKLSPASPAMHKLSLEQLLARVPDHPPTTESFRQRHHKLLAHIRSYPLDLTAKDMVRLGQIHHHFAKAGLQLRFALKRASSRRYPTLQKLLQQRSPDGRHGSFLATRKAFAQVQLLQRQNRVVPLVGDFAGERALPGLGRKLKSHNLRIRFFYVSNVEQYLLAGGLWPRWQQNLQALPFEAEARFIRVYLDQGQRHPEQLPHHRSTTLLQPVRTLLERAAPYRNALELSTDNRRRPRR